MAQKYYYKFVDKDMTTKHGNKIFKWKLGENRLRFVFKGPVSKRGLHVFKSLKSCSCTSYPRVFLCTIGKIYGEDFEEVRTNKVTLIKELKPSAVKDSQWCYYYCRHYEDRKDVRENITDPKWAYEYCVTIKDRKDVAKNINDDFWSEIYKQRKSKNSKNKEVLKNGRRNKKTRKRGDKVTVQ